MYNFRMLYKDTRDTSVAVDFKTAVLKGMNSKTGGLFVPETLPKLPDHLLSKCTVPTFREIALETTRLFAGSEIPDTDIQSIIIDAYPFPAQVVPIDRITYVLELFHGPTCAFKDFGARFMARVMSYFNKDEDDPLHILVATSGDTGSAVGSAFHNVPGLDVTILYPTGKISPLQEKQLSTFTGNVRALSVDGTFDDCQKLVKTAFTDEQLRKRFRLSSANSINIARLLPQSFYYTYAAMEVKHRCALDNKIEDPAIIMSVPSGNFGNLTSGLIAREMGAPITGFIAATNSNHTIPDWINSGIYEARPSVQTYSNAMDVGAPSNYERIRYMYSYDQVRSLFASYWLDNPGTLEAIKKCNDLTGYIIDPHGAVGWQAWYDLIHGGMEKLINGEKTNPAQPGLTPNVPDWANSVLNKKAVGIVLETAHPSKFGEIVSQAIHKEPPIPDRLQKIMKLPDMSIKMKNDYATFKDWLISNL